MKIKYFVIVVIFIASSRLHAQEVRVTNSFIILVDNKLTTSVMRVNFVLSNSMGKEELIEGDYYPGVLNVKNIETKDMIYADSVKSLTLTFDNYEYSRRKQIINNYKIAIDRAWFKQPLIILRITDINKRRGTYKYSFEVPGYSFGRLSKRQ